MLNLETYYSKTRKFKIPCGSMFVTICFNRELKPEKLFIWLGKNATCPNTLISSIAISVGKLFSYETLSSISEYLKGHYCGVDIKSKFHSCLDELSKWLGEIDREIESGEIKKLLEIKQKI